MAQPTQMLALRQHNPLPTANINSVWMLVCVGLCLSVAASQPESSVTLPPTSGTFMATTNATPSQVTTTRIPEPHLSHDGIEPTITRAIDAIDAINTAITTTTIDTDRPDAGRYSTADKARAEDPLGHRAGTTGDDANSRIRTIFFETVDACIGLATLVVAVFALRRMPKQKHDRDTESQSELVELDAVETAVEMQCEEPAIRNINAQAAAQPSGSMAMIGRSATLDDQADLQPTSK